MRLRPFFDTVDEYDGQLLKQTGNTVGTFCGVWVSEKHQQFASIIIPRDYLELYVIK